MRASVEPLVLTSEQWAAQTIALYPGEIAWENAGTFWYMLCGDGEPCNGGTSGGYTRLRVPADTLTLNVPDFPLDVTWLPSVQTEGDLKTPTLLDANTRYLCKVINNNKIYELPISIGSRTWAALVVPETELTVARAFETMLAGFFRLESDVSTAAQNGDLNTAVSKLEAADKALGQRIDDEATAREDADTALKDLITGSGGVSDDLATETRERKEADVELKTADEALGSRIDDEKTARENADDDIRALITGSGGVSDDLATETRERKEADADIRQDLYAAQTALEKADEELNDLITGLDGTVARDYAPLESPRFTGEPEVPDPLYLADGSPKTPLNLRQAVPLKTWKELYDFTAETAGSLIRQVDTATVTAAGSPAEFAYQRKLDVDPALAVEPILREVDHEGYALRFQLDKLWDIVMTTFGDDLRKWDTATASRGESVIRMIDRADDAYEWRKLDKVTSGGGDGGNPTWVDYTAGVR